MMEFLRSSTNFNNEEEAIPTNRRLTLSTLFVMSTTGAGAVIGGLGEQAGVLPPGSALFGGLAGLATGTGITYWRFEEADRKSRAELARLEKELRAKLMPSRSQITPRH